MRVRAGAGKHAGGKAGLRGRPGGQAQAPWGGGRAPCRGGRGEGTPQGERRQEPGAPSGWSPGEMLVRERGITAASFPVKDLPTGGDTRQMTAALLWGCGEGSVGTAVDDHVLREVGQLFALFLILLVLAFFSLGPQLDPCVFADDVPDAGGGGGGRTGQGQGGAGRAGRPGQAPGWHSLGFLSPQVGGNAPHEVALPLLQLQGFSALDVADELAFFVNLHLVSAWRAGSGS